MKKQEKIAKYVAMGLTQEQAERLITYGQDDYLSLKELSIKYDIAWYEQKAVIVLLALLYLGVKNIKLGPTLPAFLSPNIKNFLVEKFNISTI